MTADTVAEASFAERLSEIEEAYEFMLAYAARGHPRGVEGDHIRNYLERASAALEGIGEAATVAAAAGGTDGPALRAVVATLEDDARKAQAGLRLALAQRAISSQLIDNLNASIHLRALLTDLFLIDEAVGQVS
jgi:hypothetical protein